MKALKNQRPTGQSWGPAWLHARERKESRKSPTPSPPIPRARNAEDVYAYNEECWSQVSQKDYEYLTGDRNWPAPCPWCAGRLLHSQACERLRRSWEPTMPFGKHKGRPVSEVPVDYLYWLVAKGGLVPELMEAIDLRLSGGCN